MFHVKSILITIHILLYWLFEIEWGTLRILPYLVRNSTQNTEIRICYFGYGNAHLLNTETLMVT